MPQIILSAFAACFTKIEDSIKILEEIYDQNFIVHIEVSAKKFRPS